MIPNGFAKIAFCDVPIGHIFRKFGEGSAPGTGTITAFSPIAWLAARARLILA